MQKNSLHKYASADPNVFFAKALQACEPIKHT